MNYIKKAWVEMTDREKLTFLEQGEFQVHETGGDGPALFLAVVEYDKEYLVVSTSKNSRKEAQEYGDRQVKGLIKTLKKDLQTPTNISEDK